MAISARTTFKINTVPRTKLRDKVRIAVRRQSIPTVVRWSLFLFIFTMPFEAAQLPFTTGSLSVAKISGLLLAATYFFYFNPVVRTMSSSHVPTAMWWLLGYFLISALTLFSVPDADLGQFLSSRLTRLQLIVLFWILCDLLRDAKLSKLSCILFVLASIILSIGMTFNLFGIASEVIEDRFTAFGFNMNTIAGLQAVGVVAGIGLLLNGTFKGVVSNTLLLVSLLPILGAAVATGSRSGIATAIIGCLVYWLSFARTRRKAITIGILVIGLSASVYLAAGNPLLKQRWEEAYYEDKLSGRTEIYPVATQMFSERPVFGWGAINHSYELGRRTGSGGQRGEHNLLLSMLLEVGLVGTIPFLVGIWLIVRAAWRARTGTLGYLPIALLAAIGANTMVENGLDPRSKVFWLVVALAATATPAMVKPRIIRSHAIKNGSSGFRVKQGSEIAPRRR